FQHGRFNAHEVFEAAAALRFYAIGLCGYAALKVLVPAFYAIDRRKTPMFVSFGAVAINLLLNWLFTVRLGWGHQGLAFSTACIATTNFLLLYVLMHRHLGRLESLAMLSLLARLSVACAVLAGICWAGDHYLLAAGPWSASGRRQARSLRSSWSGPARSFSARPCCASARCRTSRSRYSAGCAAAESDGTEGVDMRDFYPLGVVLLVGAWTQAPAQNYTERYYGPEQHVHWHMDTGYVSPTGQTSDFLQGGWTIGGGLSWQPDLSSPLALRADLNYSRFNATRHLIGIN